MNGTGGRETAEGPAHRFNHNRWSQPTLIVSPPGPGIAMIACACGVALGADDMVRAPAARPVPEITSGGAFPISRIVCAECAARPTGSPMDEATEEDES